MTQPIRITVLQTHPIQYMAPWFRHIARERQDVALTVLYAAQPTASQQGVGFGQSFEWDDSLTAGYAHQFLLDAAPGRTFDSVFRGSVDVPDVDRHIAATRPDAVLIPGWHSKFYRRGLAACRKARIPVLYRGDSSSVSAPAGPKRLAWRLRTRWLLRQFDGYLSVGTRVSEYLEYFGAPHPLVFSSPAAVDNGCFAAAADQLGDRGRAERRTALGAGPDDLLVMFAGKFVERKRPHDVLAAAARMRRPVVVAMVGSGPLDESLRREAERLGVRVTWCGFLNQADMRRTLPAVDCVVVPSLWETWGLIVNEALAAGTPCVVSEGVAAHADLIRPGSGAVHPAGDVDALCGALTRIDADLRSGAISAESCRAAVAPHSFAAATEGLVRGARRVAARVRTPIGRSEGSPRVLAAFGQMVLISGVERMSFEVLRTLRESGAALHGVVNGWGSAAVVDQVDRLDGSWSTGYYMRRISKHPRDWPHVSWDVFRTSLGLLIDAARFRPTHVFVPEFTAAIRSAPTLWLLKRLGIPVALRLGTPPDPGALNRFAWRNIVDPCVSVYAPNSDFIQHQLLAHGINPKKSRVIRNTVPTRAVGAPPAERIPGRIIYVGQIIPPKGVLVLLDALEMLLRQGVTTSLDIVGGMNDWAPPQYEGYRERVRQRAESPTLAPYVQLLGTRDDVPQLMSRASLHCLPSWPESREGFAVVTLEAKQAGVPSVVTPSGALPETVSHRQDGWVCRDGSAEAVAEGLEYFLADPQRLAWASCRAAESSLTYNRERFARAWAEVFAAP